MPLPLLTQRSAPRHGPFLLLYLIMANFLVFANDCVSFYRVTAFQVVQIVLTPREDGATAHRMSYSSNDRVTSSGNVHWTAGSNRKMAITGCSKGIQGPFQPPTTPEYDDATALYPCVNVGRDMRPEVPARQ